MTDRNFNPTADNVVALANDMKQMISILVKTVEDLGALLLATPPPKVQTTPPEVTKTSEV